MIYIITLLFFMVPILTIPLLLIGICMYKEKRLWLLFLLAIVIAIFSYYFEPPDNFDLYKYFKVIEKYKYTTSIVDIFKVDYEVLFCIILYIISKIGNYRLLSCIFTLFSYFAIFYIIDKYSRKIELSNIHTFIVLLFFMLTFNYINFASGLRNATGIIISLLAIYLEYVEKKSGFAYKLLYIIPCLMHKSLFIIIIFRLIMMFDYKKIKKIYIPIIICLFFSGELIITLSNLLSNIPILSSLGERAVGYIGREGNIFESPMLLYNMAIALFISFIYIYNKKTNKLYIDEKLYQWINMILLFCIAMMPYKIIFARFITLYNLLSIFIISDFLKNEKNKANYSLIIIAIFIIFIVSVIPQYSTLKNISFGNLFTECIIKNVFNLFLIN